MATLTGAQGISTGQYHAAVLTNNELWETSCVQAGRMSGDLCVSLHLMHIFLHFFFTFFYPPRDITQSQKVWLVRDLMQWLFIFSINL